MEFEVVWDSLGKEGDDSEDGAGRAGGWRRNLKGEAAFSSFVPAPLQDVQVRYDGVLASRLSRAEFALGRLTGLFESLDAEQREAAVGKLRRLEAEASWDLSAGRIRPAITAFQVFGGDGRNVNERDELDIAEIGHLEEAVAYAVAPFDGLPLSRRLLTRAHFLMTQGPRYEKKYPGEVRRSPTWLGRPESTLSTASFVFPMQEDMDEALAQLERYIHDDTREPELVRVALAHYQFEVIHPFIDGNGRIGRLLSQLMLIEAGQLPADILLLSAALKDRAEEYYTALERVERFGAYEEWIGFFAIIVADAAERSSRELGDRA